MTNITIVSAGNGIMAKLRRLRFVAGGLDHAIPVYALLLPSEHLDQDIKRLPQIQGYSWKRSHHSGTKAVIMILTKNTSAQLLDSVGRAREE